MARRCERPDCGSDATVSYGFDPQRRVVWLDADTLEAPLGGALCADHADAVILPLGWWLDDRRAGQASLFKPMAALTTVPARPPRPRRARSDKSVSERPRARSPRPRIGEMMLLPLDDLVGLGGAVVTPEDDELAGSGLGGDATAAAVDVGDDPIGEPADEVTAVADVGAPAVAGVETDVVAAPVEPVEDPAPVVPWMPVFRGDDDLDGLLDARTPLLARAFGHRPRRDDGRDGEPVPGRRSIPRTPRRLG